MQNALAMTIGSCDMAIAELIKPHPCSMGIGCMTWGKPIPASIINLVLGKRAL